MKYRLTFFIGKVHIEEPHVAAQRHERAAAVVLRALPSPLAGAIIALDKLTVFLTAVDKRDVAVILLGLLVDELKNALGTGHRHGDGVDLLRDLRDVVGKLLGHTEERCHNGDGHGREQRAGFKQVLE